MKKVIVVLDGSPQSALALELAVRNYASEKVSAMILNTDPEIPDMKYANKLAEYYTVDLFVGNVNSSDNPLIVLGYAACIAKQEGATHIYWGADEFYFERNQTGGRYLVVLLGDILHYQGIQLITPLIDKPIETIEELIKAFKIPTKDIETPVKTL